MSISNEHTALLASITDAELLSPIGTAAAAGTCDGVVRETPALCGGMAPVPEMAELLSQVERVGLAMSTADLPSRTARIGGVPLNEQVSGLLRANGGRLSEQLRAVVGEHIHSAHDLQYALRVFAAHALNSLVGNRYRDIAQRERAAATAVHEDTHIEIKSAVLGEVAAIKASSHLTRGEFQYLLELVDQDRCTMAQNLAGPGVDVPALADGRGMDWRALSTAWAEATTTRGTVTFEAGKDASGPISYLIEAQPGAGWVLSLYVDQAWIPVQASEAGLSRALAERAHVLAVRATAAKPAPALSKVFADELAGRL